MNPERWQHIDRLVQEALDCRRSERDAFLDKACDNDIALRREVDSILSCHDQAGNFMENSPSEVAAELLAQRNPELAAGQSVGAYEIIGLLGSGGMGEVYRARDTRLGREVALKVLPPELAENPQWLKRFEQEARAASAMNHPNIITVHDIGVSDSTHYIVMELVDGSTLRDILSSGPMAFGDLLNVARQLAAGLAKAHSAGIIHRDLKPENVMVTRDGLVKILDFGLASPAEPAPDDAHSDISASNRRAVLGTIGYMSPELAAGAAVDFRSDQFSFGSILYEMAAGRRAFQAATPMQTLSAIMQDDPEPIGRITPALPAAFVQVVERCLSKNSCERFNSTQDLARAIGEIGGDLSCSKSTELQHPSLPAPERTHRGIPHAGWLIVAAAMAVAVTAAWIWFHFLWIPPPALGFRERDWLLVSRFENHTGDPQMDGIVEYFLQRGLSSSGYILIAPPERIEDMLRLMKKPLKIPIDRAIGREICLRDGGIRALIAGRIEATGPNYVIVADVVDPVQGVSVISEIREIRDKNRLPQEIGFLAERLRERFGETRASIRKGRAILERVTTADMQALHRFTQGMDAVNRRNWTQAEQYFKDALAKDPDFASAHAYLYWTMRNLIPGSSRRQFPDVDTEYGSHARRAFELADGVSEQERYFILGTYYRAANQQDKACASFKALSDQHPDHYWAANNAEISCRELGNVQDAIAYAARKAEIRSHSVADNLNAAQTLLQWQGDWSRAAAYADRAEKLLPDTAPDQARFVRQRFEQLSLMMLWYRGDMASVAKEIDRRIARVSTADAGDRGYLMESIANASLNIGRLRTAEEWFAWTDNFVTGKTYSMIWVAIAKQDTAQHRFYLTKYLDKIKRKEIDPGYAEWFPIMLENAGLPSVADEVLKPKPAGLGPQPETPLWRHIATLIRAHRMAKQGHLTAGDSVFDELMANRAQLFKYRDWWTDTSFLLESRLLAETLDMVGDPSGATRVLEDVVGNRQRFQFQYADSYLATRAQLARLYRKEGRVNDAQNVEDELLKLLACADPDHPILRQIREVQRRL